MTEKPKKPPTLLMRTAFFVDSLRYYTGLGMPKLERIIRENLYEAYGLPAPSYEIIRDYFRLQRVIAYEPKKKTSRIAPWLLAAEIEFPGAAFAFFHPIFDILYGQLESSIFWKTALEKIPDQWIEIEEKRGNIEKAKEWRTLNASKAVRTHHRKKSLRYETLAFIHLLLMRFGEPYKSQFFSQDEAGFRWYRTYSDSFEREDEIFATQKNFDGLGILYLLLNEAAELGDLRRYDYLRQKISSMLPDLCKFPGCRRIGVFIRWELSQKIDSGIFIRGYSRTLCMGLGLPAYWRRTAMNELLDGEDFLEDDGDELHVF